MMASTLSHSVSSMAHLLSANLSRNPRCLRAEASIFAIAYTYGGHDLAVRRGRHCRAGDRGELGAPADRGAYRSRSRPGKGPWREVQIGRASCRERECQYV